MLFYCDDRIYTFSYFTVMENIVLYIFLDIGDLGPNVCALGGRGLCACLGCNVHYVFGI